MFVIDVLLIWIEVNVALICHLPSWAGEGRVRTSDHGNHGTMVLTAP